MMANSNILGGAEKPIAPPGHGTEALGPSDSSDSGSDVVGAQGLAEDSGLENDPGTTSDMDRGRGAGPDLGDANLDSDSDSGGTGERRGAGRDDSSPEAADIRPDTITRDPGGTTDAPDSEQAK